MELHPVIMRDGPHKMAWRYPEPLSWKTMKLTTYPSGGVGSRWLVGGTLYSGRSRLVLRCRRPSCTSSCSFFSITKERIHGSAGRTGLFPAMGAGIGIRQRQERDDGGSREWLMEAKERGDSCKRLGGNKRNPGLRIYTPTEGQWADPAKRQVKFPHLMPLPNCSLETCMHRHVSAIRSPTACHAAHYHTVSTSSLKKCTPTGGEENSQMDTSR
jgi:hypothetical protein